MRQVLKLVFDTWDVQSRSWGQQYLACPTWPQVEASIRSLDAASKPVLTIILNEAGSPENCLLIQGGNGKYQLDGTTGNGRWFQYFDRTVEGFSLTTIFVVDEERMACEEEICANTDLVVEIAREFITHNAFRPEANWRVTSEPEEPLDEEVLEMLTMLSVTRRVTITFRGGPLAGMELDSQSSNESERWDVAWLLAKTRDDRMSSKRVPANVRLRSQDTRTSTGEYEVRGSAANAYERHLFLFYQAGFDSP